MNVLAAVATGLVMGLAFGIALEKSRVFEPGVILGQLQLRNFIMLKVFLSAVITGLLVLAALNGLGLARLHPKATLLGADLLGGAMLGFGIALAGACPGTVLAQLGAGYRDAWATLLGGLLGAGTFIYLEPTLKPVLLSGGPGKLTFDVVLQLPFWVAALGFAAMLLAVVIGLERWRPWHHEIGENLDGLVAAAPDSGRSAPMAPPRSAPAR
jgi:hypothetical protein